MIKSKSHRESSFCIIQNNLKKQIQKMNKTKNINDNLSHKIYVNKKIYTHSKKINDIKKTTLDTNTTSNTSTSIERNSLSKIPLSPFSQPDLLSGEHPPESYYPASLHVLSQS